MKIKEIQNYEDKQNIPSLTGTLESVYERKSGESKYGPWSFQNAVLRDGDDKVKIKLVNLPCWEKHKGRKVRFQCKKTQKGLFGVRMAIEEYKGKEYKYVEVRDGAEITFDPEEKAESVQNEPAVDINSFRRKLMQAVNAYDICLNAAKVLKDKHDLSDEHYKALTASLFIYADKHGCIGALPDNGPIAAKTPETVNDTPEDEPEEEPVADDWPAEDEPF